MSLAAFLDAHDAVVRVRLTRVRGSSPREAGAEMLVAAGALHGTVGGGRLELMAIDKARAMLRSGARAEDWAEDLAEQMPEQMSEQMDVPLGPEIGQCCGGRVTLTLAPMTGPERRAALADEAARRAARPHVYILGAGHVGRALAVCLAPLPVRAVLVDGRAEELARAGAGVETRLSPLPEAEIAAAPPGSAFVVLTHDHALDFLLTTEALARGDAPYVGLIGSATKRARFERFCREEAPAVPLAPLVCPIGATGSPDKRPEVIAAFVAAEIMTRLTTAEAPKDRPA